MGLRDVSAPLAVSAPAGWVLSLYPQAGEASGAFVSSYRPARDYVARGSARDPHRSAQEAGRRARSRLRRYCAANRLNRLGTLTYGPPRCTDPRLVREHVGTFFRDLRSGLGGDPLPYVWVPELHKDGVFHLHFAVGRYVRRALINEAWGRGIVHIKLLGGLPVGSGSVAEARVAAKYLSKYVTKTFLEPDKRLLGMHRYDVAQGFAPAVERIRGRTADAVIAAASERLGAVPARRWSSDDAEEWAGAPAVWAQWDG